VRGNRPRKVTHFFFARDMLFKSKSISYKHKSSLCVCLCLSRFLVWLFLCQLNGQILFSRSPLFLCVCICTILPVLDVCHALCHSPLRLCSLPILNSFQRAAAATTCHKTKRTVRGVCVCVKRCDH